MVQFCGHLVDGGTGYLAARVQSPLMRVQTGKSRQQRWMNVEQSTGVTADKTGCQNAHETGQHHQRWPLWFVIGVNGI